MPRLAHGAVPTPEQIREAQSALTSRTAGIDLGFAVAGPAVLQDFDFLFPTLQSNPANLLPEAATTPARLKELGRAMVDPGAATGDSGIPAIYTYFGQFVDHDITLESGSFTTAQLVSPTMAPLPLAKIRNDLKNLRAATLELDSLYGPPAPRPSRTSTRC